MEEEWSHDAFVWICARSDGTITGPSILRCSDELSLQRLELVQIARIWLYSNQTPPKGPFYRGRLVNVIRMAQPSPDGVAAFMVYTTHKACESRNERLTLLSRPGSLAEFEQTWRVYIGHLGRCSTLNLGLLQEMASRQVERDRPVVMSINYQGGFVQEAEQIHRGFAAVYMGADLYHPGNRWTADRAGSETATVHGKGL